MFAFVRMFVCVWFWFCFVWVLRCVCCVFVLFVVFFVFVFVVYVSCPAVCLFSCGLLVVWMWFACLVDRLCVLFCFVSGIRFVF